MQLQDIHTTSIGQHIRFYESVTSTNTLAKEWAKEGGVEGSIVVAETQTAGRGRLGRIWESPKQTGIWMSVVLKPQVAMDKIPQLTLLAGYAMCEAIKQVANQAIKIKWPNDLVLNGKKICGVLCESQFEGSKVRSVIVGIGVNVNTPHFPDDLPYASSLKVETGKTYSREAIIKAFCEQFEKHYNDYKTQQDLSKIIDKYKACCINLDNTVKILNKDKSLEAKVIDITTNGELVVIKDDGKKEIILAGEVSIRGLYGYV